MSGLPAAVRLRPDVETVKETEDDTVHALNQTFNIAHQPSGNINRAHKGAYTHSSAFRAHTNGCPLHEPAT